MKDIYKIFFEGMSNGVVITSKNSEFIDMNSSFCKLLGYSYEELLGKNYSLFTHPEDIEKSKKIIAEAVESNENIHFLEKRYITKSGKILYARINFRIIRDSDGMPEYFFTEIIDIELEKEREKKNQNIEATFHATFKAIHDMMFLTDAEGVYLDFKAEKRSELLLPPEMFLGKNIRDVLPKEVAESFFNAMQKAYETSELQIFEYALLINDAITHYESRMIVTENQNVLTIVRNITERKNAEREIIIAKENAELANQVKTNFLSMMSHELRTPLNGVLGASSLLLQTEVNSEQKKIIDMMVSSGDALLNVVDDILDFSKIESGKIYLDPEPFSLKEFLHDVLMIFIPKAIKKDLSINHSIQKEIPENIFCDKSRLKQILINLIGNAEKFTNQGFISIDAKCKMQNKDQYTIEITVQDSGIGIPIENLEKIFKPFMQADVSISRRFGGTGLGLSICKKISQSMGGDIRVESKLGEGSKFIFTFQCKEFEEKSLLYLNKGIPANGKNGQAVSKSNLKILIVEDNIINQNILKRMLSILGYFCDTANDGFAGFNAAKATNYDLILMDIQMPGMDGFETTTRLLENGAQSKFFAITASATTDIKNEVFRIGFQEMITKPVRLNTLNDAILKWFP
jgi:PAS domain S-box-containing protein